MGHLRYTICNRHRYTNLKPTEHGCTSYGYENTSQTIFIRSVMLIHNIHILVSAYLYITIIKTVIVLRLPHFREFHC